MTGKTVRRATHMREKRSIALSAPAEVRLFLSSSVDLFIESFLYGK
jgi:hypothetical protein